MDGGNVGGEGGVILVLLFFQRQVIFKLDRVGPVDNRSSNNKLKQFVNK